VALSGRPLTSIWHVPDGLSLLQTKACAKAQADGCDPGLSFAGQGRRHHHDCARTYQPPMITKLLFAGVLLAALNVANASECRYK
jgi:hypothetical protein